MQGLWRWKEKEVERTERTFLCPDNALPSYGSTVSRDKAPLGSRATVTEKPVSHCAVSQSKQQEKDKMSLMRIITARPSPHSNAIHTTKYTILNFIFKNLWEQFHRVANIYFLGIALLNFVPAVEAVGKEVAFLPLLFVLSVTAIRDIFEDYRRYKSDKEVNRKMCMVFDRYICSSYY